MAARKLQTEIDRTLKKVSEGVELFESIYDKMQASTNQTQKEKQETDLKTQIKKLQRLRDQIKTWVASNDIKDKSVLLDNRRLIETQMEKFKACEKEMKTKAFSKEGLIASTRLDPKAQEKIELTEWVHEKIESLQQQVEQSEAEMESLQAGGKKKSKSSNATAERVEQLEYLNTRRKWHISRLEITLRLLDNGTLNTDQVKDIQEDVIYFVENNAEEEFDEDEGIYDELHLDDQDGLFAMGGEGNEHGENVSDSTSEAPDIPLRTPVLKRHEEERSSPNKRDREPTSPVLKKAGVTVHPRKVSAAAESKPPPSLNLAAQPMSSVVKAGLPVARPAAQLPPVKYATMAAAAVAPPATTTPTTTAHPAPATLASTPITSVTPAQPTSSAPTAPTIPSTIAGAPSPSAGSSLEPSSSPSLTHPSVTSPMLSTTSAHPEGSMYSARESPSLSEAIATSSPLRRDDTFVVADTGLNLQPGESNATMNGGAAPHSPSASGPPPGVPAPGPVAGGSGQSSPMPRPASIAQNASAFPPAVKMATETPASHPPVGADTRPASTTSQPAQLQSRAGSLADLLTSFETVKQNATQRMSNLDQVHDLLLSGKATMPQPNDTAKPRYYRPKYSFETPSYYPQEPLPLLQTPQIFGQLDVETLFFVFYYNQGTYQQYLAAKELKKQSWRFHTKYMTWFQRHSEPQAITEEYEQGVYVYFDWEGSWCQRKKADFRFEYRYLSED